MLNLVLQIVTIGIYGVNFLVQSKIQNYCSGFIGIRFVHIRKLMLQAVNKTAIAQRIAHKTNRPAANDRHHKKKSHPALQRWMTSQRRTDVPSSPALRNKLSFHLRNPVLIFLYLIFEWSCITKTLAAALLSEAQTHNTSCVNRPTIALHRKQCSDSASHLSLFFVQPKTRFIPQQHKYWSFARGMVHFLVHVTDTTVYSVLNILMPKT